MNICIARYLRVKSSPINAIWFIKTNFLEGVLKYFRLSIGAIVLFELRGAYHYLSFGLLSMFQLKIPVRNGTSEKAGGNSDFMSSNLF